MDSKVFSCVQLFRLSSVPFLLSHSTHFRNRLRGRSALAFQPASSSRRTFAGKAAPDMEGKEVVQPGADRKAYRDDMESSYGEAYSTRSSDEGYGESFGEAVKRFQEKRDIKEAQRGATSERDQKADAFSGSKAGSDYDTSQGHPVAEKEKARHATDEHAFGESSAKTHGEGATGGSM